MSHAHITIDGDTILNADLGRQQQRTPLPAELAKYLTPQTQQQQQTGQPGILALLVAFGHAARAGQDFTADLTNRPHGYDLTVDHGTLSIKALAGMQPGCDGKCARDECVCPEQ